MKKSRDKDDFLRKPQYVGGDQAMKDFVSKNMKYPEEARAAGIEGRVIVGYDVNDNGKVFNTRIIKGIGYGCDEEALRLVGLFNFSKVKNRKVRLKLSKRTSINFKLSKMKINYSVAPGEKEQKPKTKADPDSKGSGYSYTIDIK